MIKITTTNPSQCYIENSSPEELSTLKQALTYTDTGVMFNLKALKKNHWLRQNKPHTYSLRLEELEAKLTTCMLKFDEEKGQYWFRPGSLAYIIQNMDFNYDWQVNYPEPHKVAWRKPLPFELHSYQNTSVEQLLHVKHGCVELCTGAGKTAIILTLARELGLRTVIVTPSKSIFLEILEKFEYHFGKTNVGAYGNGKKKIGKLFTVCVSKSLTLLKPDTPEYEFFSNADVVIGDESHTLAAETLEKVFFGVLKNVPYRFFLSGTQVRGDGKEVLLESIIGRKVHKLTTKEAIIGDFICPVRFFVFETRSDDLKKYSDPIKSKRKHFLYNTNIADLAAKIANSAWNQAQESTLILVEELSQIQQLVSRLNVPFEYVHSASKKDALKFGLETRKVDEAVEHFNKNGGVLIGTKCIATGTNMYPCHNTINWAGGSSEIRTKQGAVGRSVRKLEKSIYKDLHKPKPYCRIYDFRVNNVDRMEKSLQKRMSMYEESLRDGETIHHIKAN